MVRTPSATWPMARPRCLAGCSPLARAPGRRVAVARQVAGAGQHQIAHPRQAQERHGIGAQLDTQPSDLGAAPASSRGSRVQAALQAVADAHRDGDHVLERAPELGRRSRPCSCSSETTDTRSTPGPRSRRLVLGARDRHGRGLAVERSRARRRGRTGTRAARDVLRVAARSLQDLVHAHAGPVPRCPSRSRRGSQLARRATQRRVAMTSRTPWLGHRADHELAPSRQRLRQIRRRAASVRDLDIRSGSGDCGDSRLMALRDVRVARPEASRRGLARTEPSPGRCRSFQLPAPPTGIAMDAQSYHR